MVQDSKICIQKLNTKFNSTDSHLVMKQLEVESHGTAGEHVLAVSQQTDLPSHHQN